MGDITENIRFPTTSNRLTSNCILIISKRTRVGETVIFLNFTDSFDYGGVERSILTGYTIFVAFCNDNNTMDRTCEKRRSFEEYRKYRKDRKR